MPYAHLRERKLHYARQGEGPSLLMIQGLGGHLGHWREHFPDALAEQLDVIMFDNAGTGRSGRLGGGDFTIGALADDAGELLAELDVKRAHVLGLSMGGMVAQELALSTPDLVEGLVLMDSSPSAGRGVRPPPETIELLAAAWRSGDAERALRASFKVNTSAAYAARAGAFQEWRRVAEARPVPRDVFAAQLDAIRAHDALDRLTALEADTLVIHGTEDRVIPVENGRMLAEAIPGARLELFEGVGHLPYLEQPQRTTELVLEFLLGGARSSAG